MILFFYSTDWQINGNLQSEMFGRNYHFRIVVWNKDPCRKIYRQSRPIQIKKSINCSHLFKKHSLPELIKSNWKVLFLSEQTLKSYLSDRSKLQLLDAVFFSFSPFYLKNSDYVLKFKVQALKLTKGWTWKRSVSDLSKYVAISQLLKEIL